jgi:nucleolar protein 4
MLKRLAMHAVKAFEKEVKDGKRTPLSADDLAEVVEDEQSGDVGEENGGQSGKKKKKFLGRPTAVKQTKIIRQSGRVDAVTGKSRSKGYGFLEMHKHADALRVLRWANNNAALWPLFSEWWVEELGDLIKQEKDRPEKERDSSRLKRMEEVERGSKTKNEGKGRLIVEFSIENVQVVKRRQERPKACFFFLLACYVLDCISNLSCRRQIIQSRSRKKK